MDSLIRANALFVLGKHKEAFDAYMAIIMDHPDAVAASNIGYMYHRGVGVMRDYKRALSFYKAASYDDGGVACFNMALMYMRGLGVEVDLDEAAKYMCESADLGCANAALYLGMAYILGYFFDPLDIECLTLIPYYSVVYRDASANLLEGALFDPALENKRYEVIGADEYGAMRAYESILAQHGEDPYVEQQCGAAALMLGKMYIEGLYDYDPVRGYGEIYKSAINYRSAEATAYLLEHADEAKVYGINTEKVRGLLENGYVRKGTAGHLGTARCHVVPLLIPAKQ